MEWVVLVFASLGAWLLVAGPIYQAALELREQELDRDSIGAAMETVDPPQKTSPLWWLLPPVAYLKQRRSSREHRDRLMKVLTPDQREQALGFMDKARGWLTVGMGALLIAFAETWHLTEHLHVPLWGYIIIVIVLMVLCFGNAAYQVIRTEKTIGREQVDWKREKEERRKRTERRQAARDSVEG